MISAEWFLTEKTNSPHFTQKRVKVLNGVVLKYPDCDIIAWNTKSMLTQHTYSMYGIYADREHTQTHTHNKNKEERMAVI